MATKYMLKALEEALEAAKADQIDAIAFVAISKDGQDASSWAFRDGVKNPLYLALQGGLEKIRFRMLTREHEAETMAEFIEFLRQLRERAMEEAAMAPPAEGETRH